MVTWLGEITADNVSTVGKKASKLGELLQHDFNIPRGFVVERGVFEQFLDENRIRKDIERELQKARVDDPSSLRSASNNIFNLIKQTDLNDEQEDKIIEAYEKINLSEKVRDAGNKAVELIGGQRETDFVAVRSSSTHTSPTGLHKTKVGVVGKETLIESIKDVWASLYSPEAIYYRKKKGVNPSMAVLIQRMVDADVSASVFTQDPLNGNDIAIAEASYGLGTAIGEGSIVTDTYRVDRNTGRLEGSDIVEKNWKITKEPTTGETAKKRVPQNDRDEKSLSSDQLSDIVQTAVDIEERTGHPIKADFSIGRNKLYVIDVAKETTSQSKGSNEQREPLVRGIATSTGSGTGEADVIYDTYDIDNTEGNVIVALEASTDLLTGIEGIRAIVTDKGSLSSNMSRLAREFNIPMIVGCQTATDILTTGETITADCNSGMVLPGEVTVEEEPARDVDPSHTAPQAETVPATGGITGTRILTLDQTRSEADGTVSLHSGTMTDSNATVQGGLEGEPLVIDEYATLLRLEDIVEGADHLLLDVEALQDREAEAVHRAIERVIEETPETTSCSLILRRPEQQILDKAVETGVHAIVVPPEDFNEFQNRMERAERSFILNKLRDI
jgi:pyruvate,water dikinase